MLPADTSETGLSSSPRRTRDLFLAVLAALLAAPIAGVLGVPGALAVLALWAVVVAAHAPRAVLGALVFFGAAVPHGMAAKNAFAIPVAGVPFHPLDHLLGFALGAWGLALIGRLLRTPELAIGFVRSHQRLLVPFGLAVAVAVVSAAIGLLRDNEVWNVARDLRAMSYYLVFPAALALVRKPSHARRVVLLLLAGLVIFSLLCVIGATTEVGRPLREIVESYWHGGRARFYFHNHYFLVFAVPYVFYRGLVDRRLAVQGLCLALLVLFIATAFLSSTRNILVSIAGAVIMVPMLSVVPRLRPVLRGVLTWPHIRRAAVVLLLSGSLGGVAWLGIQSRAQGEVPALSERFGVLRDAPLRDSSLRGRVVTYRQALEDVARAPILGGGLGMLFRVPWSKASYRPTHKEGYQPVVDMLPLTILGKSGLIGLMVVGAFGLAVLRRQWQALAGSRRASDTILLMALLSATVWMGISSLLHTVLLTSLAILPFAVLFALAEAFLPEETPA